MCLRIRTELRPSESSCLEMLEKPRGWLRLGSVGCHRSRVGEGLQIERVERYMEQRQILESREVLQLSCGTNNLKKQKSEVSSRLIDRMLSRSGFSAPNSTHSCHEGAGRKFGGHVRATQHWWIFLMNMSHPVIHMNNEMIWLQGRIIVSPGDRNHGRRVKRVKTRKMRLGMLWKSAKSQRKR